MIAVWCLLNLPSTNWFAALSGLLNGHKICGLFSMNIHLCIFVKSNDLLKWLILFVWKFSIIFQLSPACTSNKISCCSNNFSRIYLFDIFQLSISDLAKQMSDEKYHIIHSHITTYTKPSFYILFSFVIDFHHFARVNVILLQILVFFSTKYRNFLSQKTCWICCGILLYSYIIRSILMVYCFR